MVVEILNAFLSSDDFSNIFFQIDSFRNIIEMPNSSAPDQVRRFIEPDLGLNCLQMLSADDIRRLRVN